MRWPGKLRNSRRPTRRCTRLRDATATVEAIPLIVASIISKKGAAGLDAMVIDVKVGNGAFMREESRAEELAHALVSTGNSCGIKTRALLTDMNQPLGAAVGNSLEVKECIEILAWRSERRRARRCWICRSNCRRTCWCWRMSTRRSKRRASVCDGVLSSGEALECLRQNIEAQGGDPRVCDDPDEFSSFGKRNR